MPFTSRETKMVEVLYMYIKHLWFHTQPLFIYSDKSVYGMRYRLSLSYFHIIYLSWTFGNLKASDEAKWAKL